MMINTYLGHNMLKCIIWHRHGSFQTAGYLATAGFQCQENKTIGTKISYIGLSHGSVIHEVALMSMKKGSTGPDQEKKESQF